MHKRYLRVHMYLPNYTILNDNYGYVNLKLKKIHGSNEFR